MSDFSAEDDYQYNSVNKVDQQHISNNLDYISHGYKHQDLSSSHKPYENSFRNSWASSSFSAATSSKPSSNPMNSRHSHQFPPSSTSSSSFNNYSTSTPPSIPPISAVVTSTTPSSSSSSLSYRTEIKKRQSRTTNDGALARPNSIVSIYGSDLINSENSSKRSSLRREGSHSLKSLSTLSPQNEMESTDSFDRICSLLTYLITDASTAVDREVGDEVKQHTVTPSVIPLAYTESESESDCSDVEDIKSDIEVDNTPVQPQAPVDLDRDDRAWDRSIFRSRSRLFNERTLTKRRSLFLELQSCDPQQGNQDDNADNQSVITDNQDTNEQEMNTAEITIVHEEPSPKATLSGFDDVPPWTPFTRNAGESTAQNLDLPNVLESLDELLHPPNKTLRRCASFPSMKSEMVEMQHAGTLQQVIQHMDCELDRTVETINGLTRDLETIANQQSWMQTNYERSTQFQTLQYGRLGRAYNSRKASSDYFKQLCQADSPTSPTSTTSFWNRNPSSFWDRENNENSSETLTLQQESPYPLFINPNIPKSTISTDDTISRSEYGPGSPTSPGILSSDNSLSKYFDSLHAGDTFCGELDVRKLDLMHTSEDEGVMNSFREYRGETFCQNPSQRSSGSSFTFADTSCRTSALSLDGTLVSPTDTCSDYKDDRTLYSPPPQFVETDYPLISRKSFSTNYVSGSTGINFRRIRRLVMPASWPSAPQNSLTLDNTTKIFAKEKESECIVNDQGDNADDEHIPHEDAVVVYSLIEAHIRLALLIYWTAAFIVATVFVHPTLANASSRRVKEYMGDIHRLVSAGSSLDGEDQEEVDPIEEAMKLLRNTESTLDLSPGLKGMSLSRSSSVSGSSYGTRARRKLYHQRRQRDWLVGSSSVPPSNLMLYRGSPVLKTMRFFPTSESEPKSDTISGTESSATLVDLAN